MRLYISYESVCMSLLRYCLLHYRSRHLNTSTTMIGQILTLLRYSEQEVVIKLLLSNAAIYTTIFDRT